jgi:hypothetical protein
MATVSVHPNGHRQLIESDAGAWTPSERQVAAREVWRASLADGAPISGAELGRRFGLSERWGRARVAEARSTFPGEAAGVKHVVADADADADAGPVVAELTAAAMVEGPGLVTPAIRRTTTIAVLAVALTAAAASYDHLRVLADLAGEGWRSLLLPISVDGLVVAASMSLLVRHRSGQQADVLAWVALGLGLAVSLAGNVVAADPSLVDPLVVKRLVAAWPPVALALAYELLMQQVRAARRA